MNTDPRIEAIIEANTPIPSEDDDTLLMRSNQKVKLVKIMEILRTQTDSEHPLTTSQLVNALISQGISSERRSLARDIATLNECGYEIMSVNVGREKGYYTKGRELKPSEFSILIDAVNAASFIPKEISEELIQNLAAMSGTFGGASPEGCAVCCSTGKNTSSEVYSNIKKLKEAIRNRVKISFYYFDRSENGEKIYRNNRELYTVQPAALVYDEGRCHLIYYTSSDDTPLHCAVERMTDISVSNESVSNWAMPESGSFEEYARQVLEMYAGESVNAVLQFENELIGTIQDKFGENTPMLRINSGQCLATVPVQAGSAFWGWLFKYAGKMQLLSPIELVNEYRNLARLVAEGK